jgi:hypothetical protein
MVTQPSTLKREPVLLRCYFTRLNSSMFGNFHRSLIVNPKPYCFKSPSNSYIVMYSNVHCVDLVNTKTIFPFTSEASMQFSYHWALSKKNAMLTNWM